MKKNKTFLLLLVFTFSFNAIALGQNEEAIDFEELGRQAEDNSNRDNFININLLQEYNKWSFEHMKSVFWWSHFSSVLIFFIVIIIISLGLYFSYIQFRASINNLDKSNNSSTSIKINKDGVEISSSIVGLLILVISIVFFYLYLVYVYPIKVTEPPILKL